MTNPLADAALKAGLIPVDILNEMRRWRSPVEIPEEVPETPSSLEEASKAIQDVLESHGYILTRETDLHVLDQYLHTQKTALLHVETADEEDTHAEFSVVYGKTPIGAFIFPWQGDSLRPEMSNGRTYLLAEGVRYFFSEVREVFYGSVKAFMICTVSSMVDDTQMLLEEPHG